MRELEEQLQRCKSWLEIEPNDTEVIEKAKELEAKINEMQEEQEKQQMVNEILELETQIKNAKKGIVKSIPVIKGFEEECKALIPITQSLNACTIKTVNELITKHNNLVNTYEKKYCK